MGDGSGLLRSGPVRRLLTISVIDRLGTGLFAPLAIVYLSRVVHLSLGRIGSGLTVAGLIATAAPILSGPLLRRVDPRWVVVGCFVTSATGLALYPLIGSLGAFIAVAALLQASVRMDRPAMAYLSVRLTEDRIGGLAWQQTANNAGYALGGLAAAGLLLAFGPAATTVAVWIDAATYIVGAVLVATLPRVRPQGGAPRRARRRAEPRVAAVFGLNVLVALHDSVLAVGLPMWILITGLAPAISPGVYIVNTTLVVLLQVRFGRRFVRVGPAAGYAAVAVALVAGAALLALVPVLPIAAATFVVLIAAGAVTLTEIGAGSGEAWQVVRLSATYPASTVVAATKSAMAVQQAFGPLLVTVLLTQLGAAGWLVLAAIGGGAALLAGRLAAPLDAAAMAPRESAVPVGEAAAVMPPVAIGLPGPVAEGG